MAQSMISEAMTIHSSSNVWCLSGMAIPAQEYQCALAAELALAGGAGSRAADSESSLAVIFSQVTKRSLGGAAKEIPSLLLPWRRQLDPLFTLR